MDPHHEKRTKHRQDVAETSKCGRLGKVPLDCGPPPRHHPSHSSNDDEEECEMLERHAPIERSSHIATKQGTINDNREAPVYEGGKQSHDPHFLSLFHSGWYRCIYLNKKRPVLETQ
jgi:hypothetical protein